MVSANIMISSICSIMKDDSLIDENDTPIDDTDDYLDAISKLQNQTNVYVRNERIGADYAIHRMNRSYKEDVLGVMETPREREFRHLARRKTVMDGGGLIMIELPSASSGAAGKEERH